MAKPWIFYVLCLYFVQDFILCRHLSHLQRSDNLNSNIINSRLRSNSRRGNSGNENFRQSSRSSPIRSSTRQDDFRNSATSSSRRPVRPLPKSDVDRAMDGVGSMGNILPSPINQFIQDLRSNMPNLSVGIGASIGRSRGRQGRRQNTFQDAPSRSLNSISPRQSDPLLDLRDPFPDNRLPPMPSVETVSPRFDRNQEFLPLPDFTSSRFDIQNNMVSKSRDPWTRSGNFLDRFAPEPTFLLSGGPQESNKNLPKSQGQGNRISQDQTLNSNSQLTSSSDPMPSLGRNQVGQLSQDLVNSLLNQPASVRAQLSQLLNSPSQSSSLNNQITDQGFSNQQQGLLDQNRVQNNQGLSGNGQLNQAAVGQSQDAQLVQNLLSNAFNQQQQSQLSLNSIGQNSVQPNSAQNRLSLLPQTAVNQPVAQNPQTTELTSLLKQLLTKLDNRQQSSVTSPVLDANSIQQSSATSPVLGLQKSNNAVSSNSNLLLERLQSLQRQQSIATSPVLNANQQSSNAIASGNSLLDQLQRLQSQQISNNVVQPGLNNLVQPGLNSVVQPGLNNLLQSNQQQLSNTIPQSNIQSQQLLQNALQSNIKPQQHKLVQNSQQQNTGQPDIQQLIQQLLQSQNQQTVQQQNVQNQQIQQIQKAKETQQIQQNNLLQGVNSKPKPSISEQLSALLNLPTTNKNVQPLQTNIQPLTNQNALTLQTNQLATSQKTAPVQSIQPVSNQIAQSVQNNYALETLLAGLRNNVVQPKVGQQQSQPALGAAPTQTKVNVPVAGAENINLEILNKLGLSGQLQLLNQLNQGATQQQVTLPPTTQAPINQQSQLSTINQQLLNQLLGNLGNGNQATTGNGNGILQALLGNQSTQSVQALPVTTITLPPIPPMAPGEIEIAPPITLSSIQEAPTTISPLSPVNRTGQGVVMPETRLKQDQQLTLANGNPLAIPGNSRSNPASAGVTQGTINLAQGIPKENVVIQLNKTSRGIRLVPDGSGGVRIINLRAAVSTQTPWIESNTNSSSAAGESLHPLAVQNPTNETLRKLEISDRLNTTDIPEEIELPNGTSLDGPGPTPAMNTHFSKGNKKSEPPKSTAPKAPTTPDPGEMEETTTPMDVGEMELEEMVGSTPTSAEIITTEAPKQTTRLKTTKLTTARRTTRTATTMPTTTMAYTTQSFLEPVLGWLSPFSTTPTDVISGSLYHIHDPHMQTKPHEPVLNAILSEVILGRMKGLK